ncbi:conserved exported hypothetical protein [Candidatus Terasakiella magnetica]|uniref:Uncharacterized protein n=1 Tax=Candidatus Terasakiella magnetica TaxID=1867952 RepID=A0A1C3RIE1_9PROT|nr:hypothetical protein [Candidatus Terasakiella magnetica]SCA56984.1 conserved exported hypothetical protein [Candidatus Terasakiella magnetica]
MKNAFRIGLLGLLLLWGKAVSAQDLAFLSALEDVPLMAGLSEATDEIVYFDTPAGRIVEAYAVGTVTKSSILSYYKESLPSLGWQASSTTSFKREGEYLSLFISMDGKDATVRFALSPNAK